MTAGYRVTIDAYTATELKSLQKAVFRMWRLKCKSVAESLDEEGDWPCTVAHLIPVTFPRD